MLQSYQRRITGTALVDEIELPPTPGRDRFVDRDLRGPEIATIDLKAVAEVSRSFQGSLVRGNFSHQRQSSDDLVSQAASQRVVFRI